MARTQLQKHRLPGDVGKAAAAVNARLLPHCPATQAVRRHVGHVRLMRRASTDDAAAHIDSPCDATAHAPTASASEWHARAAVLQSRTRPACQLSIQTCAAACMQPAARQASSHTLRNTQNKAHTHKHASQKLSTNTPPVVNASCLTPCRTPCRAEHRSVPITLTPASVCVHAHNANSLSTAGLGRAAETARTEPALCQHTRGCCTDRCFGAPQQQTLTDLQHNCSKHSELNRNNAQQHDGQTSHSCAKGREPWRPHRML